MNRTFDDTNNKKTKSEKASSTTRKIRRKHFRIATLWIQLASYLIKTSKKLLNTLQKNPGKQSKKINHAK